MVTTPDDDKEAEDTEGREPPKPIKTGKVRLPSVAPRFDNRRGE